MNLKLPDTKIWCIMMLVITLSNHDVFCEETISTKSEKPLVAFKPIAVLETWAIYNLQQEEGEDAYELSERRLRFGAAGQPYWFMKYCIQLYADRLGQGDCSIIRGKYNDVGIWSAYATFKPIRTSELLNVHVGHLWSAVSRDYMTSPWAVSSFDKSDAGYYLRHFMTGKGNGILSGVALGGFQNFDNVSWSYRLGAYKPEICSDMPNNHLLYTGRVMFRLGQWEQKSYKYMVSGNTWDSANGVTLGLGASSLKDGYYTTDIQFDRSWTLGSDLFANYENCHLTFEYFLMKRTADAYDDFSSYITNTRLGYNISLGKTVLEPSLSYDTYTPTGDATLYKFTSDYSTFDVGVNWYIKKDKLKLSLHYVEQMTDDALAAQYMGMAFQLKL